MTTEEIKEKLIVAGIKNLKEFGYHDVNKESILTDQVYKEFFRSMLNDNLGNGSQIDKAIQELLITIKTDKN